MNRLVLVLVIAIACFADIPGTLNYQGKLTNPDGVAISGDYAVEFRIYSAETGGTAIWSESHPAVAISHGLFDVRLGTTIPLTLPFDEPYWVEIVVEGETMAPRQVLSAVPYSFRAGISDSAVSAGSVNWDSIDDIPAGFADGIDDVDDADNDPTNEVITGAGYAHGSRTLTITEAGADWDIDLSPLDDSGTDNQSLAYSSATRELDISGGAGVVLPVFGANPGMAPSSAGGTDDFLRADGAWAIPPGSDNNYVDGVSFNSATGDLTFSRAGLSDITESLDGRYLTSADLSDYWSSSDFSAGDVTNWNTAFGWGDHSAAGYLTSYTETDPIFGAHVASGITSTNISNWNTAFGWGDHSAAGYLTSYTETDPIFGAHVASGITSTNISNWNAAFGWGDHSAVGYLTSYTETDPIFGAHVASGITSTNITNWNTAFGWGDHSAVGYLTSYTETDPIFGAHVASGITSTNITNWNTAFGWGDHSAAGYLTSEVDPTWSGTANTTSNIGRTGSVGIGITSPGHKLHLYGTSNNAADVYSQTDAGRIIKHWFVNSGRSWSIGQLGTTVAPNYQFRITDETAGASRLAISTTGYVGIGTTSPSQILHVDNGASNAYVRLESDNYAFYQADGGSGNSGISFYNSGTGRALMWWAPSSNYLAFSSGDLIDPEMVLTTSGYLGIGTTAPGRTLDVNGTTRLRGHLYDYTNSAGTSGQVLTRGASGVEWQTPASGIGGIGSANKIAFWTGTSNLSYNTNFHWDNTNSRLGIGTSSPSYNLQVTGTGYFSNQIGIGITPGAYGLNSQPGSGIHGARFRGDGGTGPYVYLSYNDYAVYANGTRNYFSGNVGIGTFSPSTQLHTTGGVRFAGLSENTANTRILTMDSSGNLTWRNPGVWTDIGNIVECPSTVDIGSSGEDLDSWKYLTVAQNGLNYAHMLYLNSELPSCDGGTITAISFYRYERDDCQTVWANTEVWLRTTSATTLTGNEDPPPAGATRVYSGTWNQSLSGWQTISFSLTNFEWIDGQNLEIWVKEDASGGFSPYYWSHDPGATRQEGYGYDNAYYFWTRRYDIRLHFGSRRRSGSDCPCDGEVVIGEIKPHSEFGIAKLTDGEVSVRFTEQFANSLDGARPGVLLTPIASSANIYIAEVDNRGFVAVSDDGANVEFTWMAMPVKSTEVEEIRPNNSPASTVPLDVNGVPISSGGVD